MSNGQADAQINTSVAVIMQMWQNASIDGQDVDISDVDKLMLAYRQLRKQQYSAILAITIALSIISVIGILGNSIVIAVFMRTMMKHTSTYFLLMLAITDLIICSLIIPGLIVQEWYIPFRVDIICKLWEMVRMAAIPTSAFLLVGIAFDRYFLICKNSYVIMTRRRSHAVIILMFLMGFSFGVPPMLGVGVYQDNGNDRLNYIGLCVTNYARITMTGLEHYWLVVTLTFAIMIIIMTVLYSCIILTVYKQSRKWKQILSRKIQPMTTQETKSADQSTDLESEQNSKTNSLVQNDSRSSELATIKRSQVILPRVECYPLKIKVKRNILKSNSLENTSENNQGIIKTFSPSTSGPGATSTDDVDNLATSDTFPKTADVGANNKVSMSRPGKSVNRAKKSEDRSIFRQTAHGKTAKVLIVVSLVYLISFVPTFLMTHKVIPYNEIFFYMYFINNAANPVIYSFMNKRFRNDMWKLLRCFHNHNF